MPWTDTAKRDAQNGKDAVNNIFNVMSSDISANDGDVDSLSAVCGKNAICAPSSYDTLWVSNGSPSVSCMLLFAMCTLGFQYFSGKAYKIKSAFHLAPYLYLTILFSWLVDYFILHVNSPLSSIIGALLIFAGTLVSRLSKPWFSYAKSRLNIKDKEKQHTSF